MSSYQHSSGGLGGGNNPNRKNPSRKMDVRYLLSGRNEGSDSGEDPRLHRQPSGRGRIDVRELLNTPSGSSRERESSRSGPSSGPQARPSASGAFSSDHPSRVRSVRDLLNSPSESSSKQQKLVATTRQQAVRSVPDLLNSPSGPASMHHATVFPAPPQQSGSRPSNAERSEPMVHRSSDEAVPVSISDDEITPAPVPRSAPRATTPSAAAGPSSSAAPSSRPDGKRKCPKCRLFWVNLEKHDPKCKLLRCTSENCKFQTYAPGNLNRHLASHLDKSERRYSCRACTRRFVQKSHLNAHWRICDEKPRWERIRREHEERLREENRRREERNRKGRERRKARKSQDGADK